ncbi:uncharacterized protein [Diadema setosum]|uniref:uncharacterized protein n=1 Tax=Diadema setosum TaxID=31175 RepID=UPI003B3A7B03
MFWREFKDKRTVDAQSNRALLAGILLHMDGDQRRMQQTLFIELLCHLADAHQANTGPASEETDGGCGSPLEHAVHTVEKLRDCLEEGQLKCDVTAMLKEVQVQAVLFLLERKQQSLAEKLIARLWPDGAQVTDEEKDHIADLRRFASGEKSLPTSDTHLEEFHQRVMPTLAKLQSCQTEPFLLQVSRKCGDLERERAKLSKDGVISQEKHSRPSTGKDADRPAKESTEDSQHSLSPTKTSSPVGRKAEKKRPSSSSSSNTEAESPAKKSHMAMTAQGAKASPGKREEFARLRRPWSDEEVENLRKGVERYGTGRWMEILLSFKFDNRTNVQLKDKWRNLAKNGLI